MSEPKNENHPVSLTCCICGGACLLSACSGLSQMTPEGKVTVYFHGICYTDETKKLAEDALMKLVVEKMANVKK